MKLSLNWIKDYVSIPADMDLKKLAFDLTMSTVEVEDTIDLGASFDNIVIGVIAEILPHPDAAKLRICKVDLGDGVYEIVCGGTNLSVGMRAAVARPGARVRWHGEGDLVEIGVTKLRGVESYGMICASNEIGLFDLFPFTQEATVVDLSAFDAPAGTPLADALDLRDIILEIDNKSLTNRPDLWGHYGIAREISALYGLPLAPLSARELPRAGDFTITVSDSVRCPRYIGLRLEGLSITPAPFDIQSRIWRVGMRPINALVDITNYVMLATGQPTHAFDADNIVDHITVRRAVKGEKLLLLNDKELTLTDDDLVIADDESAVGLAGVMGGAKDSVLPMTRRVILEIANFDAMGVRHTASRYETRTEAATRYEKAIDPARCDAALALSLELFEKIYPEMAVTGFCDIYPNPPAPIEIDVSLTWLIKRLGKEIPREEICDKLGRLGFQISFEADRMQVTVPSWRATGDVSIAADMMEEVARMHGYENFEPTPIPAAFDSAINQIEVDLERKIREYLAFRCGMGEIFTYPWMSEEYIQAVLQSTDGMLSLTAPPSPSEKYLRSSLLPNLCKAVAENLRYYDGFSLFESAQVLQDQEYATPYDPRESLPRQRKNVAGAFVGPADDVTLLFRKAKGVLEAMPRDTHMEPFTFERLEKPIWADNAVWLNILLEGKPVGNLSLLAKKAALDCGIKNSAVMLFELDVDSLRPYLSRTNQFARLPEYPMTDYDMSLLFDSPVTWRQISDAVEITGGLVRSVSFVDEYKGKQVPQGKKSVTLRLVIGSPEKTLTSQEIESAATGVIHHLEQKLGAQLRG